MSMFNCLSDHFQHWQFRSISYSSCRTKSWIPSQTPNMSLGQFHTFGEKMAVSLQFSAIFVYSHSVELRKMSSNFWRNCLHWCPIRRNKDRLLFKIIAINSKNPFSAISLNKQLRRILPLDGICRNFAEYSKQNIALNMEFA